MRDSRPETRGGDDAERGIFARHGHGFLDCKEVAVLLPCRGIEGQVVGIPGSLECAPQALVKGFNNLLCRLRERRVTSARDNPQIRAERLVFRACQGLTAGKGILDTLQGRFHDWRLRRLVREARILFEGVLYVVHQRRVRDNGIPGRQVVKHIAEKLGNAIALPVLPFSPANADPEIPGDIGIPPAVMGQVLESVAENAILNGFKNVVLMGDSGGGQGPNGVYAEVAKKVTAKYAGQGARVHYADHPYTAARDAFNKILTERNLPIGQHGGIQDTSEMMYLEGAAGNWVRKDQLPNAVGALIVNGKPQFNADTPKNGITGDARKSSVELGKLRHEMKVDFAVKQIQSLIAAK